MHEYTTMPNFASAIDILKNEQEGNAGTNPLFIY